MKRTSVFVMPQRAPLTLLLNFGLSNQPEEGDSLIGRAEASSINRLDGSRNRWMSQAVVFVPRRDRAAEEAAYWWSSPAARVPTTASRDPVELRCEQESIDETVGKGRRLLGAP